jgi:hypothetical protein
MGTVLVLDRKFRVREELQPPFPLRDVHGIACFDGRVWVTCSYDNMVAIYDLATGDWTRWYPDPAHRDHDVHHFNTIRFIGGQVCLVAHRFGPSEVMFYSYPSLQLDSAVPFGVMSHDLFRFDNALATCSSDDGWLVNRCGNRLRTGNFPRGVATTTNGNLIGISMHGPGNQRQFQDGVLRWYASDWRFRADYMLPGVGMVLDVLDMDGEEWSWESVEPWLSAEVTQGEYNRVAPGNLYLPDSFSSCTKGAPLYWHASEKTHRWMAARNAELPIVINPGETRLWVDISSANPNPYCGEIRLNQQCLGSAVFSSPGLQRHEFRIPPDSAGNALLSFQVPFLWKPAELIPGNCDGRLLGLAVHLAEIK